MSVTQDALAVGLRVDVDTLRGTRDGVPSLLDLLARHGITCSFFFCVGPDNMGRHLWRLLRPAFLVKMLRSRAASLYGWDILLRGTVWPGPRIARRLGGVIRATAEAGHEVGLHAWDHQRWQARVGRMTRGEIAAELERGVHELGRVLGRPVSCSAAAGWRCTEDVLREQARYGFAYSSDCRGTSVFRPVVDGVVQSLQVPVTLPTYDELIGRGGVSDSDYNERLLALIEPDRLNVLTVHAEVEGIARHDLFARFLDAADGRGLRFVTLGSIASAADDAAGRLGRGAVPGREGWLAVQAAPC